MASLKIVTPITLLIVLFTFSEAREFVVGGHENSWSFPTSSDSLNGWAQKERFEVGDILSTLSLSLSLSLSFVEISLMLGTAYFSIF